MELDRLINYIDGTLDLKNQYPKIISVPKFLFNRTVYNNVDFIFMGITESNDNFGKAIYISKDCFTSFLVTMDDLLKISGDIQTDKGFGECDIGIAAADSLDKAIFAITGKRLQPYIREYDGKIHTEKIFFPLECEIFGKIIWSTDKATFSKYPQWDGFKESPDSTIKYTDYRDSIYIPWKWWAANKSRDSGCFCCVDYYGYTGYSGSYFNDFGVSVAFCL